MDILVVPDQHADPRHDNIRADYLGKAIVDMRPDVVVNLGDAADMASLSAYDRGKRSFHGRNYRADIQSHLDFQERMWAPIRAAKRKMPYSVVLEGNHEHRIEKALDLSPELEGTMSFNDYDFSRHYDEIIRYRGATPGTIEIRGVTFGHYLTVGVLGRPIGGIHSAYSLSVGTMASCVVGHSHLADYHIRTGIDGRVVQSVVAGCYFDYNHEWAGEQVNQLYWRGLVLLKDVENGHFDPEFISLSRLRKVYGNG